MSEEKKISLENCDFSKKKTRLNSPHSLMACHLIGVTEEDLIYLTLEEYIKKNIECQYLEKELQEERYNHFEKNRKELIELVKNQREHLIKEEENKNDGINFNTTNNYNSTTIGNTHTRTIKKNSSYGTLDTYGESSTAIKLERERLRKLKEKQELNVKLQIDYECMREENRRRNMEKMKKKEEKEKKKERKKKEKKWRKEEKKENKN